LTTSDKGRFTGEALGPSISSDVLQPSQLNQPQPDPKPARALLGGAASLRYNLSRKFRKDWRRLN
ncbi:MAG: hypothetical protein WA035_06815, partial [Trichococcus flocculiformis]